MGVLVDRGRFGSEKKARGGACLPTALVVYYIRPTLGRLEIERARYDSQYSICKRRE